MPRLPHTGCALLRALRASSACQAAGRDIDRHALGSRTSETWRLVEQVGSVHNYPCLAFQRPRTGPSEFPLPGACVLTCTYIGLWVKGIPTATRILMFHKGQRWDAGENLLPPSRYNTSCFMIDTNNNQPNRFWQCHSSTLSAASESSKRLKEHTD